MIEHVLTVCIGNICRSPAAQALLIHHMPTLAVASAGLHALDGQGIDPPMQALLQAAGVRPHDHQARTLSSWMLVQSSLVLVMDAQQKSHIERQYPATRGRVYRLGEHIGSQGRDIPDPYRQDAAIYSDVFALIEEGVQRWCQRIHAIGHNPAQPV